MLSILAHSAVLTSTCPSMKRQFTTVPLITLMLNTFTTNAVQGFMTYLYTGKLDLTDHYFAVSDFQKLIAKYEMEDYLPDSVKQKIHLLTKQPLIGSDTQFSHGVIEVPWAQPAEVGNSNENVTFNDREEGSLENSTRKSQSIPLENYAYPLPSGVIHVPGGVKDTEEVGENSTSETHSVQLDNCGYPLPSGVIPHGVIQVPQPQPPDVSGLNEDTTNYQTLDSNLEDQGNISSEPQSVLLNNNGYPLPSGVIQVPVSVNEKNVNQLTEDFESPQPNHTQESKEEIGTFKFTIDDEGIMPEVKEEPDETKDENIGNIETNVAGPDVIVKEESNDMESGLSPLVKPAVFQILTTTGYPPVRKPVRDKNQGNNIIEIKDKTSDEFQYFCGECYLHATCKAKISSHLRAAHGITQCKLCEHGLYKTVGKKGKKKKVVFQCTSCHKCCRSEQILYKHTNLHKKHQRYYKQLMKQDKLICAVCNKLLPNESVLKKHLPVHVQGERAKQKVPCDTCGKFIGRFCMKVSENIMM